MGSIINIKVLKLHFICRVKNNVYYYYYGKKVNIFQIKNLLFLTVNLFLLYNVTIM